MAEEDRFEFESLMDAQTIKSFLQSLVEGFENATLYLSSDDSEIILHPKGLLKFRVKAKRKRAAENQLTIKVSWKERKTESTGEDKHIRISTNLS